MKKLAAKKSKRLAEYLTTGVVAECCGVSRVTVLRWIEKGLLTSFKLPEGQNRIHRDALEEFAAKHNIPLQNYQTARRSSDK